MKKLFLLFLAFATHGAFGADVSTKVQINYQAATKAPDIKVNVPKNASGQNGNSASQQPVFYSQPFSYGKLYYNAVPSTPAIGNVIKIIDTKDDKDFICKIYKLNSLTGPEIKEFLKTPVLKENGQVDSTTNTETGDNYLVVTAPVFQFPYLDKVIEELDRPGTSWDNSGDPSINYKMKHRLASEVAPFIKAEKLSRDGTVYADDPINVLYICDVPSQFVDATTSLTDFDVPPEMVRIEAQIIEIEMDDDFNFGLDWDAWKAALPESVDMTMDFQKIKNNAQDVAIGNPTGTARMAASSFNLNGMKPQALANMLNYLIRKGKAKVLSRPAVVAMNRQRATIASVDRIGYTTESQMDKQAEVGITLTITPTIGSETMSLAITANVNSLMGWGKNNSPLINTRSTTANVVLKDGEMFSLSGLRKDAMTKEDERIPFFGSIPLLGYFFRHEVDVKRTYEIVVLLTPKKVTPETGVSEQHKKLLDKTRKELETKRTDAQKFVDRVILNKAP
jgi:type II secretory pathway component GspD/PulD (secretin)